MPQLEKAKAGDAKKYFVFFLTDAGSVCLLLKGAKRGRFAYPSERNRKKFSAVAKLMGQERAFSVERQKRADAQFLFIAPGGHSPEYSLVAAEKRA